nr:hypothetical protein [Alkalicoccus halolimnae]
MKSAESFGSGAHLTYTVFTGLTSVMKFILVNKPWNYSKLEVMSWK